MRSLVRLVQVLALCVFGAVSVNAQDLLGGLEPTKTTTIEPGVERPGPDLLTRPMPNRGVLDCQRLCEVTKGCRAFSFELVGAGGVPLCRIKSEANPPQASICCVSGIVGSAPQGTILAQSPPSPPPPPAAALPEPVQVAPPVRMAAVTNPASERVRDLSAPQPAAKTKRFEEPTPVPPVAPPSLPPQPGAAPTPAPKTVLADAPQALTQQPSAERAFFPRTWAGQGPGSGGPRMPLPPPPRVVQEPPAEPVQVAIAPREALLRPERGGVAVASVVSPRAGPRVPTFQDLPAQAIAPPAPKPATPASKSTAPAPVAPTPVSAPAAPSEAGRASWEGPRHVSFGVAQCLDSAGGLPWIGDPGRVLQLWDCHGGENQKLVLDKGVLWIGPNRLAQVIPVELGPWGECLSFAHRSLMRSYTLKACRAEARGPGGLSVDLSQPEAASIAVSYPRGGRGPFAGTPVIVRAVAWNDPPRPVWEHVEATGQIRLRGSNLCLSPPLGDLNSGAPLYLDDCAMPIASVDGRSGPRDGRDRTQILAPLVVAGGG
jgi:hypothetical protein